MAAERRVVLESALAFGGLFVGAFFPQNEQLHIDLGMRCEVLGEKSEDSSGPLFAGYPGVPVTDMAIAQLEALKTLKVRPFFSGEVVVGGFRGRLWVS